MHSSTRQGIEQKQNAQSCVALPFLNLGRLLGCADVCVVDLCCEFQTRYGFR